MMIRGIALAGALGTLLAAGYQAPSPEASVAWATSWEEAKAEAMDRNVPILFTIQQDENPGSKQMEGTFRDGAFIRESRRVVCVIANPDVKHGIREVMVKGQKTPYCRAYDGILCEVHTRCQGAMSNFFKEGDFDIPTQVWCKPDGKEIFRFSGPQGTGVQNAAALIKDMERALDRVSGPKLNRREWEEMKKLLNDGDEAVNRADYKTALACFKKASQAKNEKFAERGKERYDGLIKQCVNIVQRALKAYEKYPKDSKEAKEVKPILQKIAKEMKGTEAGDAADKALKDLKL